MDITSLVEIVKNNIVQFQPTIQGVVGAVLATLFLRKIQTLLSLRKLKSANITRP